MSLKQKYANWDNITDAIRPIWSSTNKKIRGNLDLWKIIHSISATPNNWQEAMDVVPIVQAQHGWLFKKNAPKLDEDLREIKNRIARGQPITRPGEQEYNKPAYRATMSIKDIWMDIKDNNRTVELPDDVLTTDLFNDAEVYDDETQANIDILKGMVAMYEMSDGDPVRLGEIIAQCHARIAAYKAGTHKLELIQQQLEQQDITPDPFVQYPSAIKHFFIDFDQLENQLLDGDCIFAQICQQQSEAMELVNLAERVEVVDVVDTHDSNMDPSGYMAVVAFWFTPEDEVMLKLQGRINAK